MTNVTYSPAAWFKCTLGIDFTSAKFVFLIICVRTTAFISAHVGSTLNNPHLP
jgi:hypothetical protein